MSFCALHGVAITIAIGVPDTHQHPTTLVLEAASMKRKERKKEKNLTWGVTVYAGLVIDYFLAPRPSKPLLKHVTN